MATTLSTYEILLSTPSPQRATRLRELLDAERAALHAEQDGYTRSIHEGNIERLETAVAQSARNDDARAERERRDAEQDRVNAAAADARRAEQDRELMDTLRGRFMAANPTATAGDWERVKLQVRDDHMRQRADAMDAERRAYYAGQI